MVESNSTSVFNLFAQVQGDNNEVRKVAEKKLEEMSKWGERWNCDGQICLG